MLFWHEKNPCSGGVLKIVGTHVYIFTFDCTQQNSTVVREFNFAQMARKVGINAKMMQNFIFEDFLKMKSLNHCLSIILNDFYIVF